MSELVATIEIESDITATVEINQITVIEEGVGGDCIELSIVDGGLPDTDYSTIDVTFEGGEP